MLRSSLRNLHQSHRSQCFPASVFVVPAPNGIVARSRSNSWDKPNLYIGIIAPQPVAAMPTLKHANLSPRRRVDLEHFQYSTSSHRDGVSSGFKTICYRARVTAVVVRAFQYYLPSTSVILIRWRRESLISPRILEGPFLMRIFVQMLSRTLSATWATRRGTRFHGDPSGVASRAILYLKLELWSFGRWQ